MKVIGFTGPAFAGKTFAANLLGKVARERDINLSWELFPFNGPVETWAKRFGWDGKTDDKGLAFLEKVKALPQEYVPDFFMNIWLQQVRGWSFAAVEGSTEGEKVISKEEHLVLVDDVATREQAHYLRKVGGKIIFIYTERDELVRRSAAAGNTRYPPYGWEGNSWSDVYDYSCLGVSSGEEWLTWWEKRNGEIESRG